MFRQIQMRVEYVYSISGLVLDMEPWSGSLQLVYYHH